MVITALAALLTLPAVGYLGANLIEWASGTEGDSGVFGSAFDGWSNVGITLLVVGGPLISLLMIASTSVRVQQARLDDGMVKATLDLRLPSARARLAVVSLLLLGGTVAYWLSQNWPCLYGSQWTC